MAAYPGQLTATDIFKTLRESVNSLITAVGAIDAFVPQTGGTFTGNISVNNTVAIITSGTGSPEAVVTAPIGSLYTNITGGAGTTLYVKESGVSNTGWIAK